MGRTSGGHTRSSSVGRDRGGYESKTASSSLRQQPPSHYGSVLRSVSNRFRKLQDEIATESVAGLEFEEQSRRTFELLANQVVILKEAFNTLVDTLTREVDNVRATVQKDISSALGTHEESIRTIRDRQKAFEQTVQLEVEKVQVFGRQVERNQQDIENILQCIPKLEDAMIGHMDDNNKQLKQMLEMSYEKTNALEDSVGRAIQDSASRLQVNMQQRIAEMQEGSSRLQERLDDMQDRSHDLQRLVEKVDTHNRDLDASLREEIEQRHLKLQKNVTRQLEGMSRLLIEAETAAASRQSNTRPTSPVSRLSGVSSPLGRSTTGIATQAASPSATQLGSARTNLGGSITERGGRLSEGGLLSGRTVSPPPPLMTPSAAASPVSRRGSNLMPGASVLSPMVSEGAAGNISVLSAATSRIPDSSPEKDRGGWPGRLSESLRHEADLPTPGGLSRLESYPGPGLGSRLETPGAASRISDTLRRPRSFAPSEVGSIAGGGAGSVVGGGAGSMVGGGASVMGREHSTASLGLRTL
eukprot:TRINITY_DN6369_c0_g1_i1.p1 TRINITY_DN6369_c0_g1~~TRINITY_DN6369_c0_g1_i1.p1  ORF type:complete len:529 (-),score=129.92 TRINITY_DN6369_c0_g1_i1:126-1712(-)